MKIPLTFIPDKGLEEKTEQLLKEGKLSPEEYDKIYNKVSIYLGEYLRTKGSKWNGVLCITDNSGRNRYTCIKHIVEEVIAKEYELHKWNISNYYHDETSKDDKILNELYEEVLWNDQDEGSTHIIYTSGHTILRIAENERKRRMIAPRVIILGL